MAFDFTRFGEQLGRGSGIGDLMVDLGDALATGGPNIKMLGGGQPARIPQIDAVWRRRMEEILAEDRGLERSLTTYDPPRGNPTFIREMAKFLRGTFGWDVSEEHVAVTSGGQTAFYFLHNLLAGEMPDGSHRKILLPLVPEYIGYANQGVSGPIFRACRPLIHEIGPHEFKYQVDFDALSVTSDIGAISVSRPTNPSGNVLTDGEILQLSALAKAHGIPLIIDNAYGAPFPGIIFTDAVPFWDSHVILTLSLSKLGLPGTRTGIVIGPPEIIRALGSMSAIAGLSNPSIGQQIATPLLASGELLALSRDVIRPFYEAKCQLARTAVFEIFSERFPWRMHRSEGALFLWLWFPGLPISSQELYERLKLREVLVIPGQHFFFGDDDPDWKHRNECIRVSYAMSESVVREGLQIIAEVVEAASCQP